MATFAAKAHMQIHQPPSATHSAWRHGDASTQAHTARHTKKQNVRANIAPLRDSGVAFRTLAAVPTPRTAAIVRRGGGKHTRLYVVAGHMDKRWRACRPLVCGDASWWACDGNRNCSRWRKCRNWRRHWRRRSHCWGPLGRCRGGKLLGRDPTTPRATIVSCHAEAAPPEEPGELILPPPATGEPKSIAAGCSPDQ